MVRTVLATLAIVGSLAASARSATPQEVDASIKRAVEWLYSQQTGDNWERPVAEYHGDQKGGTTALAVYALLASGESPQHPKIAPAIEYLKKSPMTGVYAVALRAQVWLALPSTPEIKQLVVKDANALRSAVLTKGEGRGFYGYNPGARAYSHSRGNYGVLGVWAVEQAGVEVPVDYWKLVEAGWIGHQDPSGGWRYKVDEHEVTPGMTAAGVATLFITQDYVNPGRGLNCTPVPQSAAIEKGMKWLVDNFNRVPVSNPPYSRDFPYPTLYAVERVGVASGQKYFGTINWYQRGADWLLGKQYKKSGAWGGSSGDVDDTCFALLFLARGRAPVVVNKLDYSAGDAKVNWNTRPRDVARMVRWVGKAAERELQWQIVNLAAPAAELSDAPILYLAGKEGWTPGDEGKGKIKQFVESGGMILANADCMGKGFAESVRKVGTELFPGYEFRELPNDHPIYTEQQFHREKWKNKPSVLGLSNGVRELILLIPQADPGKAWQFGAVGGREESWQLASNIVLYAVDKRGLRARGDTHLVDRDPKKKPDKKLSLTRLEYTGNWNPEPGGWRRMADLMHNRGVELTVKNAKADDLGDAKIVHLTGTAPLNLDPAAQAALKKVIDGGGTLVIDAAGGSSEFAQSAEKLIPLLATEPLKPLPPDHALYSAGGTKLGEVKYREYAQRVVGSSKEPKLQAVERDGRLAIVYSREDLSAGLVGQAVDGIVGYEPDSATAIMTRVLLHASGGK